VVDLFAPIEEKSPPHFVRAAPRRRVRRLLPADGAAGRELRSAARGVVRRPERVQPALLRAQPRPSRSRRRRRSSWPRGLERACKHVVAAALAARAGDDRRDAAGLARRREGARDERRDAARRRRTTASSCAARRPLQVDALEFTGKLKP
jgi:hypothetical protein